MLIPAVPSDVLRTPHFDEFEGQAGVYLRNFDVAGVLKGLIRRGALTRSGTYWHPNRFVVISLSSWRDRVQGAVRLHVWPKGIDRSDTDTHAHPWHLAAKVIAGTYVEHRPNVQTVAEGEAPTAQAYSRHHGPGNGQLHLTRLGAVGVQLGDPFYFAAGETHTLPTGVYHQTPCSSDVAPLITLAVMGHNCGPSKFLRASKEGLLPPIEPPVSKLADDEIKDVLAILAESDTFN